MELPDAAYEGARLADDPRYGKPCGSAQLAKTLTVYGIADPAAARVIIVTASDFEGTSPKLFVSHALRYGRDQHELHEQVEGTKQRKEECGCDCKATGVDGVSTNARERQVAVSNTKTK